MKYSAKFCSTTGNMVYECVDGEVTLDTRHQAEDAGYFVMGDIQPYKSQLTGEMVESRSRHRALLREHNCIEVGNETKYLRPKEVKPPDGLKQRIIEVVNSRT
jgi:hypothetical protein